MLDVLNLAIACAELGNAAGDIKAENRSLKKENQELRLENERLKGIVYGIKIMETTAAILTTPTKTESEGI